MRSVETQKVAAEAVLLYSRLHEITDEIGTAFDLVTVAESALDDLEAVLRFDRAALYSATAATRPVVVAVRGGERAPWADPTDPAGPLSTSWSTGTACLIESVDGRCIAVAPFAPSRGRPVGLVVVDRSETQPFSESELAALRDLAHDYADLVQAGMLAAWLQARTSHEEQSRLAHQIHNGIAQELVALGFQVDSMRLGSAGQDPDTRAQLDGVRESINRTVADIRARLADLQTDPRPESGVGALIVDRIQLVGAYTGLTVRFSLSEGGSRPPAHVEALVYRLALDVVVDATRVPDARTLDLSLTSDNQSVRLEVSHDGSTTGLDESQLRAQRILRTGATVTFDPPCADHGPRLRFAYDRGPVRSR